MKYFYFNPNPKNKQVGDCAIRAICKALNKKWEEVYMLLTVEGMAAGDMPNANSVWGKFLNNVGFEKRIINDNCPECYTLSDFCQDHPEGVFVVATSGHVVAVEDGTIFDSWDSSAEVPIYYFEKKKGR